MNKSDPHVSHDAAHGHPADHSHHPNYIKIYWILLVLLAASVAGPMIGIQWVTLITAFGIAVVKAYLVAANFMHLRVEKRYITYLMFTVLAIMMLFYAGVAPDVMNHRGRQWENVAAQEWSRKALLEVEQQHKAHTEQGDQPQH
jgi:caa(3)-type oxidase subunit IV